MSEQILPLPLSGAEITKQVLHTVEQMLRRDCYLNPVAAYETVTGTISVRLKLKDCGRECVVDIDVPVAAGEPMNSEDPDIYLAEADRILEAAPPNVVRQDTGQPLPVLTEDSTGKREVKRVTYARPQRTRAQRPDQSVARGVERATVTSPETQPEEQLVDATEVL